MCAPLLALAPLALSAVGGASGVAAISAGVGALSTITGYLGTQAAHHSAVQAASLNYAAADEKAQRQNVVDSARTSEDNLSDAVAFAQSQGRIAASASTLGLGQYSLSGALNANAASYNRRIGISDTNAANERGNIQADLEGAALQRNSAIANAPKANLGSLALGLAGNALQGISTYGALGGKFGVTPQGGPADGSGAGRGALY